MFGGPIFRGWNEILLLGKALKFGVIFLKYALKFIKNWKILRKFEKNAKFSENFLIFGRAINFYYEKIKNLIWSCYNGGLGGGAPAQKSKKFQAI